MLSLASGTAEGRKGQLQDWKQQKEIQEPLFKSKGWNQRCFVQCFLQKTKWSKNKIEEIWEIWAWWSQIKSWTGVFFWSPPFHTFNVSIESSTSILLWFKNFMSSYLLFGNPNFRNYRLLYTHWSNKTFVKCYLDFSQLYWDE